MTTSTTGFTSTTATGTIFPSTTPASQSEPAGAPRVGPQSTQHQPATHRAPANPVEALSRFIEVRSTDDGGQVPMLNFMEMRYLPDLQRGDMMAWLGKAQHGDICRLLTACRDRVPQWHGKVPQVGVTLPRLSRLSAQWLFHCMATSDVTIAALDMSSGPPSKAGVAELDLSCAQAPASIKRTTIRANEDVREVIVHAHPDLVLDAFVVNPKTTVIRIDTPGGARRAIALHPSLAQQTESA